MKCDSVGLTVSGAVRLVGEIRKTKLECETASIKRKRLRDALAEAKARLDRLEHSEALLKNRRSELVHRGLQTLKVEPDGPPRLTISGAPPLRVALTQESILDPSSLFLGGFPINPQLQADLDVLFGRAADPAASKGS